MADASFNIEGNDTPATGATQLPPTVRKRIARGREAMLKDASKRRLCIRFERGDTYYYLNNKTELVYQNTTTNPDGSGKPAHRIRNTYNVIRPLIQGKVSRATQRTPAYQVLPSTNDQNRKSAAELAQKASRYGYDQWGVGAARRLAALYAIGQGGEAFLMPYFDPNVGPYIHAPDGEYVGQGEIKCLVLSGNEVYWEPGCAFRESGYWVIERAVPVDEIKQWPGFLGGTITADAKTSDIPSDKPAEDMAMLTQYFERPGPKFPDGRYFCVANGRMITLPDTYPIKNADGETIDEPILHRLAWDEGDGSVRDFGLTWQLIDSQRTVQDCLNKILEWKNRALLPQMLARAGTVKVRRTDEPGAMIYFEGMPEDQPKWETVPEIPQSLFRVIDTMMQMMRLFASDDASESQADLTNVAAKTLQQVLEESLNRWDAFRQEMAEWDGAIMRHCLLLCARHYSEPRLMKIKGINGWEKVADFTGSDLMGEVDVRVFADSLVPQTRQGVQDQLTWINTNFPGWLQPLDALACWQEGSIDRLIDTYWLDIEKASSTIQSLRDGTYMQIPTRTQNDPLTGQPVQDPQTGQALPVPGYMPTPQDSLPIWKRVFGDWMKTDDYARQPLPVQDAAQQIWQAIEQLEAQKAQQQAMQMQATAQQLGSTNAAKPQTPGMPPLPGSGTVSPPT